MVAYINNQEGELASGYCVQVKVRAPRLVNLEKQKSPDYVYIATFVKKIEALDKLFLDINTQSFKQSNSRESDDNSNLFFVANSTLVLYFTSSFGRFSGYNFTELNYSQSSEIEQKNRTLESLHSVFIRKRLSNKGLQEEDINLFSVAYNLKASKTFLKEQLDQGKAYNIIASYRSAISKIYDLIKGKKVESHFYIVQIMKGIYNSNLPPLHSDK
ncbi:16149_t:CDS:2, partial [Dentiscutata erythropus]